MPKPPRDSLSQLANDWDANELVRSQLRGKQLILTHGGPAFHATVAACGENHATLLPVLEMTREKLHGIYCTEMAVQKKNDIIRNLNFRLSHWLFMKH